MDNVRIDQWLHAARFFKTRGLAKSAVEGGKVALNGQRTKPAKTLRLGDTLTITRGDGTWTVVVDVLEKRRAGAAIAQTWYTETEESQQRRGERAARLRLQHGASAPPRRRPNKKDRRALRDLKWKESGPCS